jgi:hypothetical protein
MIDIYNFINNILNNPSQLFTNIKNEILNNESIIDYILSENENQDIDIYIFMNNNINFNQKNLNYYNINHLIYLNKISKNINIQKNIMLFYDNILLLKNKIYDLCEKHKEKKYYNIIDNITSHIIYNIHIKHLILYKKYDYFKKGIYYKIKNKICYYYDVLNYILDNYDKLYIVKYIESINSYIKNDLYFINKYENNNIFKILIY